MPQVRFGNQQQALPLPHCALTVHWQVTLVEPPLRISMRGVLAGVAAGVCRSDAGNWRTSSAGDGAVVSGAATAAAGVWGVWASRLDEEATRPRVARTSAARTPFFFDII